ncbi:uncharacterized protein Gasu_45610 [Galdieria sulphuraria]|uniref:RING-type domain-containing protein n=1 Tax=Galdieria sulphuraria TaxID=130081 RepID=M2XD81_GALSU|nr:uncharacterized protein Gasu_45610 [Galdieria sulphuraria]EME27897.1 hypothetical protein Gasu_45610 [Galdieria sulphuraria]|eukprot:XP_005704417.1 hypothetical protein Gasu_45610 [Galdieria sulphuraria]
MFCGVSLSTTDSLVEIIKQLNQEFLCNSCGFELCDPVRLQSCGHVICSSCAKQGCTNNFENCPSCHSPVLNIIKDGFTADLLQSWKEFRKKTFLLSEYQREDLDFTSEEASSSQSSVPCKRSRQRRYASPPKTRSKEEVFFVDVQEEESKTPNGPKKLAFSVASLSEGNPGYCPSNFMYESDEDNKLKGTDSATLSYPTRYSSTENKESVKSILETPFECMKDCDDNTRTIDYDSLAYESPKERVWPRKSLSFDDIVPSCSNAMDDYFPSVHRDISLEELQSLVYELNDILFRISRIKLFSM